VRRGRGEKGQAGRALLLAAIAPLAAACLAAGPALAQPDGQDRLFNVTGPLDDAAVGSDGAMTFRFFDDQVRYRLSPQSGPREGALVAVLDKARGEHLALNVVYDSAGARFDSETGRLELPVCRLESGRVRFDAGGGCGTGPTQPEPGRALARAYGNRQKEDFAEAARILATVPQNGDPGLGKFVLWLRADTERGWELIAPRGSEEADRHRVAAVRAYRELSALEPGNIEHRLSMAHLLVELGAYDDADKEYRSMLRKWPEESFRIALGAAALARNQAHYKQALEILDAIGSEPIAPQSMRYHYHRAWTLSLLGHYDEAIADLTAGLEIQPDFWGARARRGCARAALGRLREAIEDLGRAGELLTGLPGSDSSAAFRLDREAVEADRRRVADALAAGHPKTVTGICRGAYWPEWERPRTRSRLLPAS
jgi:tetratricopeptide (TPR) repeat protein